MHWEPMVGEERQHFSIDEPLLSRPASTVCIRSDFFLRNRAEKEAYNQCIAGDF